MGWFLFSFLTSAQQSSSRMSGWTMSAQKQGSAGGTEMPLERQPGQTCSFKRGWKFLASSDQPFRVGVPEAWITVGSYKNK